MAHEVKVVRSGEIGYLNASKYFEVLTEKELSRGM
jgi:hypothetical protein